MDFYSPVFKKSYDSSYTIEVNIERISIFIFDVIGISRINYCLVGN